MRRQEGYKEALKKLVLSRREEIEKSNCDFIEIYKRTPLILEEMSAKEKLSQLKFEEYTLENFQKNEPSIEEIRANIESKSRNPINKLLFWKKSDKSDPNSVYERELKIWQEEKLAFEDQEKQKKEIEDRKRRELYNQQKRELEGELADFGNSISSKLDKFLNDLMLPVEFSIDYQYYQENKILYVDLDLPENEDMPQKKAIVSSSGKLIIKPKTNKELKEDYARCVIGLGFYLAGNFFNMIQDIRISQYRAILKDYQNQNKDHYSIKFNKKIFKNLNMLLIDPIVAIQNFEHIINITGTCELKTIRPIAIQ